MFNVFFRELFVFCLKLKLLNIWKTGFSYCHLRYTISMQGKCMWISIELLFYSNCLWFDVFMQNAGCFLCPPSHCMTIRFSIVSCLMLALIVCLEIYRFMFISVLFFVYLPLQFFLSGFYWNSGKNMQKDAIPGLLLEKNYLL